MEKIEVKVRNPNTELEIYVNGALVRSVVSLQALKRYLRWLWNVNEDYNRIVTFDLQTFFPDTREEIRDYIFG